MPGPQELTSRIYIRVGGTEASKEIMNQVMEMVVDQHVHLPGMFSIRLTDPGLKLIDEGPFDLTKEVIIEAADEEGTKTVLIKGEITDLEPCFEEGMNAEVIVRGYDKMHRLYRQTRSAAFIHA
jgi:hypothetical protein